MPQEQQTNEQPIKNLDFIKEVAKYFMDFLETDFKRTRIPKRNTISKVNKDLKIAIDLEKYDNLKKVLIKNFNEGFAKEKIIIKKGEYTNTLPDSLLNLIKRKIKDLKDEDLGEAYSESEETIKDNFDLYSKEYDRYIEETKDAISNILSKKITLPFLDTIDKPLENKKLADENSKFQFEIDINETLFNVIESGLSDLLQEYFGSKDKKDFNLSQKIKDIIRINEIKEKLNVFFQNLAVGDAFLELFQLYRNNQILDKSELYLYFYEISINREKFPLFYTSLDVERMDDRFEIAFDKKIFVNTKAISYVIQEYNLQTENNTNISTDFDRIIYISNEDNFYNKIYSIIKKLEDFFEFNREIDLQNDKLQEAMNLVASISNRCYLFLFDKSDEALINDYEEILESKEGLIELFAKLINGFIEDNPISFIEEVEDEWYEKSIPDKLVVESPVPLNDEQKQALMALDKPDCKFLILEGPPGTGKSHTITAIICRALLEEKSVLVLSDKKEALDVVEDKINQTLENVRNDKDFQNPILRLGKSGNKFNKIVQGQTIEKIKEHYNAYRYKKDEYEKRKDEILKILKDNIKGNIEYFKNISLEDVENYFNNIDKFSNIDWITNEPIENIEEDFLKIKDFVKKIKTAKSFSLNDNYLNEGFYNFLLELREKNIKLRQPLRDLDELKVGGEMGVFKKIKPDELKKYKTLLINLFENYQKHKSLINNLSIKIIESSKDKTIKNLLDDCQDLEFLNKNLVEVSKFWGVNDNHLDFFGYCKIPQDIDSEQAINTLNEFINELVKKKKPIIGYLGQRKKIDEITRKFKKTYYYFNIKKPERETRKMQKIYDLYEFLLNQTKDYGKDGKILFDNIIELFLSNFKEKDFFERYKELINNTSDIKKLITDFDDNYHNIQIKDIPNYAKVIEYIVLSNELYLFVKNETKAIQDLGIEISKKDLKLSDVDKNIKIIDEVISETQKLLEIKHDFENYKKMQNSYPEIFEKIGMNLKNINLNVIDCKLLNYTDIEIKDYLNFKRLERKLDKQFNGQPNDDYIDLIEELERQVAMKMTYFLDERIINYTRNCPGDVRTLRGIISKKQKFPKYMFNDLKKSFPCMLAGIRDYAEYIPFEKDLFDLIIIDEASQVSIAQALPALIRGKQIVVLGDDKQFSNVKSNNASNVINKKHESDIRGIFRTADYDEDRIRTYLSKVEDNFDIKNSILKFLEFIRNYRCVLKKHFRCYPEIISYSKKYFYDNTLQCMKVRSEPIESVIKFDFIKHDGKIDEYKNTNDLEVDYIIEKIKELKENGFKKTLGIITPHREQVTLLTEKIYNLPERDWIINKDGCHLKIMTFDTCQGEERDYIFYSMVATKEKDRLKWVFPADMVANFGNIAPEEKIKWQRLNVGFSRAKDCIHFVLSKPVEEFQGEIKNALFHYKQELELGKKKKIGGTDENSPMEEKIQKYIYQTDFYNEYSPEVIPQFPIGEYLKQLDKNYIHPNYKVDFLMIYKNEKIIIEYDGFKEHFLADEPIDSSNYKYYMKDDDVYRQKVLEGYGYKFLRVNKFNLGEDPVKTLDEGLREIVKKNFKIRTN